MVGRPGREPAGQALLVATSVAAALGVAMIVLKDFVLIHLH
jgi:hypothetical protein